MDQHIDAETLQKVVSGLNPEQKQMFEKFQTMLQNPDKADMNEVLAHATATIETLKPGAGKSIQDAVQQLQQSNNAAAVSVVEDVRLEDYVVTHTMEEWGALFRQFLITMEQHCSQTCTPDKTKLLHTVAHHKPRNLLEDPSRFIFLVALLLVAITDNDQLMSFMFFLAPEELKFLLIHPDNTDPDVKQLVYEYYTKLGAGAIALKPYFVYELLIGRLKTDQSKIAFYANLAKSFLPQNNVH